MPLGAYANFWPSPTKQRPPYQVSQTGTNQAKIYRFESVCTRDQPRLPYVYSSRSLRNFGMEQRTAFDIVKRSTGVPIVHSEQSAQAAVRPSQVEDPFGVAALLEQGIVLKDVTYACPSSSPRNQHDSEDNMGEVVTSFKNGMHRRSLVPGAQSTPKRDSAHSSASVWAQQDDDPRWEAEQKSYELMSGRISPEYLSKYRPTMGIAGAKDENLCAYYDLGVNVHGESLSQIWERSDYSESVYPDEETSSVCAVAGKSATSTADHLQDSYSHQEAHARIWGSDEGTESADIVQSSLASDITGHAMADIAEMGPPQKSSSTKSLRKKVRSLIPKKKYKT